MARHKKNSEDELLMSIREYLRQVLISAIKSLDLTHAEAAERLGLDRTTAFRVLRDENKKFTADSILKYLGRLGFDVMVLLKIPEGKGIEL